jgi:hypothetical protein
LQRFTVKDDSALSVYTVQTWQCCNTSEVPAASILRVKGDGGSKYLRNACNNAPIYNKQISKSFVQFEVFMVATMKNGVFWDVTPCGSCNEHQVRKTKKNESSKWHREESLRQLGNVSLTMTCLLNWSLSDYHPGSGSRTSSPCGPAVLG